MPRKEFYKDVVRIDVDHKMSYTRERKTGKIICHTIEAHGVVLHFYRSEIDGRLVVDIDTKNTAPHDEFENGIPKLRLMVNDEFLETNENGDWVEPEGVTNDQ